MKVNKTVGPDGVSAEVYKYSNVVKAELFCFLKQVWKHEHVPKKLVIDLFVMFHKKACKDDLTTTGHYAC